MYKYSRFLTLLLLCYQYMPMSAQTSISGDVFTSDRILLTGVTVRVLQARDSTFVAATITDTIGHFSIKNLKPANYLLSFSIIGYKNHYINLDMDANSYSDPIIVILQEESILLDGVTLVAEPSPFTFDGSKTTVKLSQTVIGSDGTILDALKKIPGILIQNDGTILLNGQPGASVMIDNKLTYMTAENLANYLRSIPVSSVDKIELIPQPSSRYDASGASGLINIQRKKKYKQGLSTTFTSSLEKGKKVRTNENISLNLHHNKINVYADYSFYTGRDFIDLVSSRHYLHSGLKLDMMANRQQEYRSNYIKSGVDVELSKKINTGLFFYSNWYRRTKDEKAISDFYTFSIEKDSSLVTNNVQHFDHDNLSGRTYIDYKWNKRIKFETLFNFQLFGQGDELKQNSALQEPGIPSQPDILKGTTRSNINIYDGQTDMSYIISDELKWSSGLKYASIKIKSTALYSRPQAMAQWQNDPQLSSRFVYNERIYASYVQLEKKWNEKLSTDMGLRLEHTVMWGKYITNNQDSLIPQSYSSLFPTLQIKYQPSREHRISFQYGKRIVRPNYRDINPFVEVNDRYLHERGNPQLIRELIHNFEGTWSINSQYIARLFYLITKDPIAKSYLIEDSNSNTTTVLPLNLSRSTVTGLQLSMNNFKPCHFWTVHINSSLIYRRFLWQEFGALYKNGLLIPTMQISSQISFPLGWSVETTGYYRGKTAEGQAKIGDTGLLSIGLRKNLFDNKLGLYLYANDIFLTNRPPVDIKNSILDGFYRERRDTRTTGITATYRITSGERTKEMRRKNNSDETTRINLP